MRLSSLVAVLLAVLFCPLRTASSAEPATMESPAERTMTKVLPELTFQENALADTIDFLRDVTGTNIVVHWNALEASTGIVPNTPVIMRVRNIKVRKALDTLMASVVNDKGRPAYKVVGPVIAIGTPASLENLSNLAERHRNDPPVLLKQIPEFRPNGIAFTDLLDFLHDAGGVDFQIDWPKLAKAGIQKTTPVSLRLSDVSTSDILVQILALLSEKLDYRADGKIEIYLREKPSTRPVP